MEPAEDNTHAPHRDFLAEAARLALQMDPVAWDFDLTDLRAVECRTTPVIAPQPWQNYQGAALATQGALLTDVRTSQGNKPLCSIYKPELGTSRSEVAQCDDEENLHSSSNDERPDDSWSLTRNLSDDSKLRVRDKSKGSQKKWRHKHKQKDPLLHCNKTEEQKTIESLHQQLSVILEEKSALEAHTEVLEKALMNMSMENAKVQEYISTIRECLTRLEVDPQSESCKHLKALLDERLGYLSYISAINPSIIHRLTMCNLLSDPLRPDASSVHPDFHSNILRKIQLTEEQAKSLVESRNSYLLGVGYHSAALARLQGQMMVLDPTPLESLRRSSYMKWVEASRALQETTEEIHLCHVRLHFDFYHGTHAMTTVQTARMLVESFPYLPDVIALVRELANKRSAPSAVELFRTGAMRYSERQGAADIKVSSAPHISVTDRVAELVTQLRSWKT